MRNTSDVRELIEKLVEVGIDCRTNINQEGILTGISFKYNNQSYKGTQLGLKSKEIESYYTQKRQGLVVENKKFENTEKSENDNKMSAKKIFEENKLNLSATIEKLVNIQKDYNSTIHKVIEKMKDGENNIDNLFKIMENSNFIINDKNIIYKGFSFPTKIISAWMTKSIFTVHRQIANFKKKNLLMMILWKCL